MALAIPSQVSAGNINSEFGIATSTLLRTANNWVKNVASISNSTNLVNYGKLRWGLNFPGRNVGYVAPTGTNLEYYDNYEYINLFASSFVGPGASADANVYIQLSSSGVFTLYATAAGGSSTFTRTWLTSGVNSDYTANVVVSSGSFNTTSSPTNQNLSLSTTRIWEKGIKVTSGASIAAVTANLIIRSEGTELIRRKIVIEVTGDVLIA